MRWRRKKRLFGPLTMTITSSGVLRLNTTWKGLDVQFAYLSNSAQCGGNAGVLFRRGRARNSNSHLA